MKYPLIVKLHVSSLICKSEKDSSSFFKCDGDKIIARYASNPKLQVNEIIDSEGFCYTVRPIGKIHMWAKFFAPIHDFTKILCHLEKQSQLNIGDCLKHMGSWKDVNSRLLKKHLSKYEKGMPLNQTILEEFFK